MLTLLLMKAAAERTTPGRVVMGRLQEATPGRKAKGGIRDGGRGGVSSCCGLWAGILAPDLVVAHHVGQQRPAREKDEKEQRLALL
jgi:hypothetical protein